MKYPAQSDLWRSDVFKIRNMVERIILKTREGVTIENCNHNNARQIRIQLNHI